MSLRSKTNADFAASLKRAAEALVELDREGRQVHALVIRDGRPVLLIETPRGPIAGMVSVRSNDRSKAEALWFATVAGCRVEWAAPPHLVPVPAAG